MIEEFMKYVCNYDKNKEAVVSKIEHSLRVYEMMLDFASELKFTKKEIELAGLAGLLHDIGRFDQIKLTSSMCDHLGFDHADHGVKLLFEEGLIKNFYKDESHYPVLEFAIKNHNKYAIEKTTDEFANRLTKLLRDVDKIDIFYLLGTLGMYDTKKDDSEFSKKVLQKIENKEPIQKEDVKTHNDHIACTFAYAFDVNYDISLKYLKKNVKAFYEQIDGEDKFKSIYDKVMEYLDERIDKSC